MVTSLFQAADEQQERDREHQAAMALVEAREHEAAEVKRKIDEERAASEMQQAADARAATDKLRKEAMAPDIEKIKAFLDGVEGYVVERAPVVSDKACGKALGEWRNQIVSLCASLRKEADAL